MTRFTATASVTGEHQIAASASFIVTDGRGGLVGAEIVPFPGEHLGDAVADFELLTGRPLLARRQQHGDDIPLSAAGSGIELDRGKPRKSLLTFSPARDSRPADLDRFLGECADLGITAGVEIWPEAHRFMPPAQYRVLCELYVPVIHEYGYAHTFTVSNYAAVTADALDAYWPGAEFADAVGIAYYPAGLSLTKAGEFADRKGVPLGLAEFGVDLDQCAPREGISFLEYIEDFFTRRIREGLPCGDLIWMSGMRDGDFRLMRAPEFVAAWQLMYDTLIT